MRSYDFEKAHKLLRMIGPKLIFHYRNSAENQNYAGNQVTRQVIIVLRLQN